MENIRKYKGFNLSNYRKKPQISLLRTEDMEAIEVVSRVIHLFVIGNLMLTLRKCFILGQR